EDPQGHRRFRILRPRRHHWPYLGRRGVAPSRQPGWTRLDPAATVRPSPRPPPHVSHPMTPSAGHSALLRNHSMLSRVLIGSLLLGLAVFDWAAIARQATPGPFQLKFDPDGKVPYHAALVKELLADARAHGDARRGLLAEPDRQAGIHGGYGRGCERAGHSRD